MAVAIGLLGLSALAAGFAGMRARATYKPDIVFAKAGATTEDGMNKFSITLLNKGSVEVKSPFILNITLGGKKNPVYQMEVMNPPSKDVKGSTEKLESKLGSFDVLVKNYNLKPGESTTITYWFVIPSDYDKDDLPFAYTWDTTNLVDEKDEKNTYTGSFDIEKMGLVKEAAILEETPVPAPETVSATTTTPTTTTTPEEDTAIKDSSLPVPMPDLVIEDFNITNSTIVGSKKFTVVVKNIGNATAQRPPEFYQNYLYQSFGLVLIKFYFINENGEMVAHPAYINSKLYNSQNELAPGKSMTVSQDIPITDNYFSDYTKIKMKVDWLEGSIVNVSPFIYPNKGYILESNEDNNEMTKMIRQEGDTSDSSNT